MPGRVGVTGGSRWVVELPAGRRPVGQDGPGVAGREVGTCGNALIRAMDENERAYRPGASGPSASVIPCDTPTCLHSISTARRFNSLDAASDGDSPG